MHCTAAYEGICVYGHMRSRHAAGAHLPAADLPVNGDDTRLFRQVRMHAAAHATQVHFVKVWHRHGVADRLAGGRRLAAGPRHRGAGVLPGAAAVAEVWAGVVLPARCGRSMAQPAGAVVACRAISLPSS